MPMAGADPPDCLAARPADDATSAAETITAAVASLEAEFSAFLPKSSSVDAACAAIRTSAPTVRAGLRDALSRLLPLLGRRAGAVAETLFALLADLAAEWPDPASLYHALLGAKDPALRRRAIDEVADAVAQGRVLLTDSLLTAIAEHVEQTDSGLTDPAVLATLESAIGVLPESGPAPAGRRRDLHLTLLVEPCHPAVQRLAARLLDLRPEPPSDDTVGLLLGRETASLLGPYLEYTRATHLDLVDLLPVARQSARLEAFRRAERVCGKLMLASALAELGWARVNDGLEAQRLLGISVAGSFPFVCRPEEARLFDGVPDARRAFDRVVLLASGRRADRGGDEASPVTDAVTRFRASSVVHAELLGQILDVAPLTRERLRGLVDGIGRIVSDFRELFARPGDQALTEEAAALERIYLDLRDRIEAEVAATTADALPMSVCRLVQPFEDPSSPSAIRTLHGLKRYLHQRGLKLAFSLIGTGPATGRSVDLAVATSNRDVEVVRRIEFVDLEGESPVGEPGALPYAVSLAAEAYTAHAVHGRRAFPHMQVFCYGNEVHYFVTFRNHPAFIRVDFSPPLRGGMIDLQYLGVSTYDLSHHPNTALDAIRRFFERLDFVVDIDTTRVHARYDKERAVSLEDLHRRVRQVLHLVPYLMDIDWAIGGLDVKSDAKRAVAEAWSAFFDAWGVLPYERFLTADRRSILTGQEEGPDGLRETRWDGRPPYRDRFPARLPPQAIAALADNVARTGLELTLPIDAESVAGQTRLDATVLEPLRVALGRGEVEAAASGLHRRSASTFECIHEVERLADILDSPAPVVADAARLAALVPFVERHTRFETSGSINGYRVQRAKLALGPVTLGLFCLRDALDMPRLAAAADARALRRRRDLPGEPWIEPDWWSAERVARLLRRANLLGAALEPLPGDERTVADNLRAIWRVPHVGTERRIDPSERVVSGRAAAPGRAAGLARLGAEGRRPDDLEGSILIAPALESADAPLLWRAAGIVSTGGGILSHLGLIAVESGKPAMILDASWGRLPNGETVLSLRRQLHDERRYERDGWRLVQHHNIRYVDDLVREGDLVIVDADDESFSVLGQDPVTLAFHEALHQHGRALARFGDEAPESMLVNRGHLLRARHQLERAASRVGNPALARHGVREILLGAASLAEVEHMDEAMPLLRVLLDDPRTGQAARDEIRDVTHALAGQVRESRRLATVQLPSAATAHDALALRLNVLRPHRLLRCIAGGLDRAGLDADVVSAGDQDDLDAMVVERLAGIRERLVASATDGGASGGWSARLEQARSIDHLLGRHRENLALSDRSRAGQHAGAPTAAISLGPSLVVTPDGGGSDLGAVAGTKAANLAEASRVIGAAHVPGWFALTDEALRAALDSVIESDAPSGGRSMLREGIEQLLARADLTIADKAAEIRDLWLRTRLYDPLADAIRRHYTGLGASVAVAVRSSVFGEDSADVSCAGLFDTYLFVQGERDVMQHVKLAWAGFWNERALHDRLVRRDSSLPRGGLVVQRMVRSRVAGVVQTINAAESRPGEIVINVGLGLGEGIVSGRVAADHVVVAKDGNLETLRFRYLTADKRRRVVLDERFGRGTLLVETLAHQRLRPALEYPELCAIVEMAVRLEQAYAQPVDLEFGFEDAELHVLQVRPVPGASAVWAQTAVAFPLRPRRQPQEDRP